MAKHDAENETSSAWLADSGRSNHMIGQKDLSKALDETQKQKVKLGDNKVIQIEGKGIFSLKTSHGEVKLLHTFKLFQIWHIVCSMLCSC